MKAPRDKTEEWDMRPKTPYRPKLYFASKLRHAPLWRSLRDGRLDFCDVRCSWIDAPMVALEEAGEYLSPADYGGEWTKDIKEAASADFTLLYHEGTDRPLSGALIECGATLAAGGSVIIIGRYEASWTYHPRVIRTDSLFFDDAITILRRHLAIPPRRKDHRHAGL